MNLLNIFSIYKSFFVFFSDWLKREKKVKPEKNLSFWLDENRLYLLRLLT